MTKKITLYSPCDGVVSDIKEIEDTLFADRLLGDGFFIKPTSEEFYSPVDGKITQIFYTKHAFYFKVDEIDILMHIGLDTVTLEGKPFKVAVKENMQVNHETLIVEVDLNKILESKIKTDTPIVFSSNHDISFKLLKFGNVLAGEPICEINYSTEKSNAEKEVLPVSFTGKYDSLAFEINNLIGGRENYKKFYNCMTRLRIIIRDKNLVNIEKIKKIPILKGTNWNGEELQIIIGGEVYKVRESLEHFLQNNSEKNFVTNSKKGITWHAKLLAGLGGIVTPILPVIIGVGLLKAIASVLQISGAIQTIPTGTLATDLSNYYLSSLIVYLISDVGLIMIGFFFGYSTIKYLGGNTYVGGLIALTLVAPSLFNGKFAFTYFTLLNVGVGIKGYTSSVIPQVGAAFIYFYFDKWVQKWIPKSVDIIFRHTLAMAFTTLVVFLLVGPFLGFFEAVLGNGVKFLNTLPFGIGTSIYSGLRQILVLTGLHTAVTSLIGSAGWYSGQSFNLMLAVPLAVFGQIGSGVGIICRTKNSNIRAAAYGSLPAAVFGITEPIVYGVNLPKVRTFFLGCIGAASAGLVAGIVGVNGYSGAGQGVLFFTGMFPTDNTTLTTSLLVKNILGYSASMLVAIVVSFSLVILFYKERVDEVKGTKKLNRQILSILIKKYNLSKYDIDEYFKKEFNVLENLITDKDKSKIKKLDNLINKKIKLQIKITKIQGKEDRLREKYSSLANKYYLRKNIVKVAYYNELFYAVNLSKNLIELNSKLNLVNLEMEEFKSWLDMIINNYLKNSTALIEKINSKTNSSDFDNIYPNYFNTINSMNISYQITEPMDVNWSFKKSKLKNI